MYYTFSLHVFLNVWPNVTGALLLSCTQWVLTCRGQPLHVFARSGYVGFFHTLKICWAKDAVQILSVWNTVHSITTVLLQYTTYIIWKRHKSSYILFLILLFLKSLYDKIICHVLPVCWYLNIIQCSAIAHVSIQNWLMRSVSAVNHMIGTTVLETKF